MTDQKTIARIIRDFNWADYNLPELAGMSPEDADYARDLAGEIAAELDLSQARAAVTLPSNNGPVPQPTEHPLS